MTKTRKIDDAVDFSAADAMTAAERHAAAMSDPDCRPMTDEEWAAAPRVPRVSIIRRALRLSQEDFAARFHIPIGPCATGSRAARSRMRRLAPICR